MKNYASVLAYASGKVKIFYPDNIGVFARNWLDAQLLQREYILQLLDLAIDHR